ncbi:MAG: ATP-binding protein [Steroidobacteraceae bacterium]
MNPATRHHIYNNPMASTGSIERKTFAGLLIALITLAVMSFVAVRAIQARENSSARLSGAQQNLLLISQLHADISEVATAQDGLIVTNESSMQQQRQRALNRINSKLQEAEWRFVTAPQQSRVQQLRILATAEIALLDQALQLFQANGLSGYVGSTLRDQAQIKMNEINAVLGSMVSYEEALIKEIQTVDRRSARRLYVMQGLVLGLSLATLLWLAIHVRADLLARRRSEALLQAANAELELRAQQLNSSNQELESFCYSVSHDLRAPLRTIDGFAQVLQEEQRDTLNTAGLRYLQTIRSASARMTQLIDDLLMYSKLGRQSMRAAPLDMNGMAHKAAEQAAYGRAVPVRVDIQPLAESYGDESMLQSVWMNLIDNAVKYSGKAAQPHIHISCIADEEQVTYSVHDNGVGFDMKDYEKLFGVFQRLHANNEFPGTGVGLAIVERIVSRHGGKVWAESAPGEGATFFFSMPRNLPRQLQAAA